jgi:acetate kinase
LELLIDYLENRYSRSFKDDVAALGHRIVHGKHISEPVLVDEEVLRVIEDAADLAPLHNPANLQGIRAASAVFQGCPQVRMLGEFRLLPVLDLQRDIKPCTSAGGSF